MWPELALDYCAASLQVAIVYYSAASVLHLAPRFFHVQSLQSLKRSEGQVQREALTSIGPLLVKGAVLTAVQQLHKAGVSLLYDGPLAASLPLVVYHCATVLALDFLHDTWFYWTHRLLHWRPLYRSVHRIHHESRAPTAFAGYSFHWAEALLVFANEVLVCFLFPIHARLHRAYHLFTTVIHNGGHAGYEIAPFVPSLAGLAALLWQGAAGAPWGRQPLRACPALNTVRHHDLHHSHPACHFALYFTHWDRWAGTEHPSYRAAAAAEERSGGVGTAGELQEQEQGRLLKDCLRRRRESCVARPAL